MTDHTAGYGRLGYGEGPYGDDPEFDIEIIRTNSPVEGGDTVRVTVEITNNGGAGSQEIDMEVSET